MRELSHKATKLSKKLKFSFSESRLNEKFTRLKVLNDDLHRISSQVTRIAEREVTERKVEQSNTLQSARAVADCRKIAVASEALHRALQKACTKHTKHAVYLSHGMSQSKRARAHFNLSFTHSTLSTSRESKDLAWFDVVFHTYEEQAFTSDPLSHRSDDVPADLTRILKRQLTPPVPRTPKNLKSNSGAPSASCYPTPPSAKSSNDSVSSCTAVTSDGVTTQLYARSNFCNQIRGRPERLDFPIGLLDQCENWKQVVYPPSRKPGCQQKTSLADLVSLPPGNRVDSSCQNMSNYVMQGCWLQQFFNFTRRHGFQTLGKAKTLCFLA